MLELRSVVFNIAFLLSSAAFLIVCLPTLLIPRAGLACARAWARTTSWLLATICNVRHEVHGLENIIDGGSIVAAKHQSAWETIILLEILPAPAMVLKRELQWIPLFGCYTRGLGHLAVNRDGGASALKGLLRRAREAVAKNRQVTIFPEGTRRLPGAPPDYQRGVVALYRNLGVPCTPVALNSGYFWPRRDWRRRPGTITVEILEPIPPGLEGSRFLTELEARIETASNRIAL